MSINNHQLAELVVDFLARFESLVEEAKHSPASNRWIAGKERKPETYAVWLFFKSLEKRKSGEGRGKWTLYPKKGPATPNKGSGNGEYLVDWALFEDSYGPRIVSESQWGTNIRDFEWALDKLRGVKGDLKFLNYERQHGQDPAKPNPEIESKVREYLSIYGLLSKDEVYLFLEFQGGNARAFSFRPIKDGIHQSDEISLVLIPT